MTDETYNGYANRETWAFNLHWQNDQGLYNDTLRAAQDYIDGRGQDDPTFELSDYDLGEYIVDYWRESIDEYNEEAARGEATPFTSEHLRTLRMFDREVGSWWRIDCREVGASVRESLGIED